MSNVINIGGKQPSREMIVHEIQWHMIPEQTKTEVMVSVFALLAALDEAESLKDISNQLDDISKAFAPCYEARYCVQKSVPY